MREQAIKIADLEVIESVRIDHKYTAMSQKPILLPHIRFADVLSN